MYTEKGAKFVYTRWNVIEPEKSKKIGSIALFGSITFPR